jgi:hypothetical protein
MTADPFIILIGNREVGRAAALVFALAKAPTLTPAGCEGSLHLVRHAGTGETWVRHSDGDGGYYWTGTSKSAADKLPPRAGAAPSQRKPAPVRTAFEPRLPYRDD